LDYTHIGRFDDSETIDDVLAQILGKLIKDYYSIFHDNASNQNPKLRVRKSMSEPVRILVIDDDESVRKILTTILKEEGYVVDTAETGKEAIKKNETNSYNLALIDVRLPDMDGTKLLTAMQKTNPKMVKIMVTGYPSMRSAIEAVNKGADGYILKPIKIENLLKTIREHL